MLVGGSFIGTELAASFTALGKHCEIVMLEDVTHEHMCGPEVGRYFQRMLTEMGVKVHGGQELERFEGDDRVRKVVTKSGLQVECDFVVIGAGRNARHHAGRAGRAEDRCRGSGRQVSGDPVCPGSSRRETSPSTTASYTSAPCGSSTGTRRSTRAAMPRRTCSAAGRNTTSSRTSGPTSRTGPAWSTSAPRAGGTRSGSAGISTRERFTAFYVQGGRLAAALTVGRSDDLTVAARLLKEKTEVTGMRAVIEDTESELP